MKCYAAYAKDIEVRNLGSSGGIYPVIATEYIKKEELCMPLFTMKI